MPFAADFENYLRQYVKENPKNKHGANTYSLQDYGQTLDGIGKAFAIYAERFIDGD